MTVRCGSVEPNQSAANAAVCDLPAGHGGMCEGGAQGPAAAERPGRHQWAVVSAGEHTHEWVIGSDVCAHEGCNERYPMFTCPLCGAESSHPDDVANRYCGRCHLFIDDAFARVAEKLKDMTMDLDGMLPGRGCVELATTFGYGDRWTSITVRHASLISASLDGWDVEVTKGAL